MRSFIASSWKNFAVVPRSQHSNPVISFQTRTKVSALSLTHRKRKGQKITMCTAYDFPSAVHVARADMDVILVGDSVAMVELGYDTTQPLTLEQSLHHCQAVQKGVQFADTKNPPLLVGDMPFGSYEYEDTDVALRNAYRFVKEAGMDAVKLEVRVRWWYFMLRSLYRWELDGSTHAVGRQGGSVSRARTAGKIVDGGIAVMGHIGLTPQAISVIGGFRAQGRTAVRARALLDEALRLQDAGCFSIVLECVPANVAKAITDTLEIPTIGIGAGGGTSGQVLVFHDMLGMLSHPHHEQFVPKFCKKYASIGHIIQEGLQEYRQDVENGTFPGDDFAPYVMKEEERVAFEALLAQDEKERERKLQEADEKYVQTDEYEKLQLYGAKENGASKKK